MAKSICALRLCEDDEVAILKLTAKNLGHLHKLQKTTDKSGRKTTPLPKRKVMWNFWHENSQPTTITSRHAKQKVSERSKIHEGLDFVDTVNITTQRKKKFNISHWYVTCEPLKKLYHDYKKSFPVSPASYGTFLALHPFYGRPVTTCKDCGSYFTGT